MTNVNQTPPTYGGDFELTLSAEDKRGLNQMSKTYNPWSKAKKFRILGYYIPVLKGSQPGDRRFYTELHKDDAYLASMGSDMPTYWLAALETYLKRGRLLDE